VPALRVETATSSGVAAVYSAYAAISAGFHRSILVVGGEKMTHVATPRVSEIIGRSIDPHEKSYGTTMPALAGLVTRAAMHRRGFTLRRSQVAVKNHAHGAQPLRPLPGAAKLEVVMRAVSWPTRCASSTLPDLGLVARRSC
jgi:acetyl-CoA acetyltransferase